MEAVIAGHFNQKRERIMDFVESQHGFWFHISKIGGVLKFSGIVTISLTDLNVTDVSPKLWFKYMSQ